MNFTPLEISVISWLAFFTIVITLFLVSPLIFSWNKPSIIFWVYRELVNQIGFDFGIGACILLIVTPFFILYQELDIFMSTTVRELLKYTFASSFLIGGVLVYRSAMSLFIINATIGVSILEAVKWLLPIPVLPFVITVSMCVVIGALINVLVFRPLGKQLKRFFDERPKWYFRCLEFLLVAGTPILSLWGFIKFLLVLQVERVTREIQLVRVLDQFISDTENFLFTPIVILVSFFFLGIYFYSRHRQDPQFPIAESVDVVVDFLTGSRSNSKPSSGGQ
jgi:hypothetical protein